MEERRMQPTEDERVLAALSHASIVANIANLAGMITTALIWTMQRERSRYVRAHALQSLVYQGAVLVISVFLVLSWGLCMVLSLLPVMLRPDLYDVSNPPRSFWLALLGLPLPIGFGLLATIYGLYGAYQVYRGRPFRYPLVSRFRLVRRDLAATTGSSPAAAPPPPPPTPAGDVPAPVPNAEPAAPAASSDGEPAAPPDPAPPTTRRTRRRPPEK
jgi:uncharacterized Tic20 family protein